MANKQSDLDLQTLPLTEGLGISEELTEASPARPRLVWINATNQTTTPSSQLGSGHSVTRALCHCNPALANLASTSSLLMLQGPIGPLFSRIARWKRNAGHQVKRVVFNAGDEAYGTDADILYFRHGLNEWSDHLRTYLLDNKVDGVLLFGQSRAYHEHAIRLCQLMGIPVFVMEEGYVRPGFLTLEMTGVNALSSTLQTCVLSPESASREMPPASVRWHRCKLTFHAIAYYLRMKTGAWRYPRYVHHRHDALWRYAAYWVIAAAIYPFTRLQDKKTLHRLDIDKPYFFVPMQIDSDAQIVFHSRYKNVAEFIDQVLKSFAEHAPADAQLVIKQHPLARGRLGERHRILQKAADLGIADRVIFVHFCRIYQLLDRVAGVVTVNSTVGVQAIAHGAPLKIMGEAIYDHPDVADPQPLDSFWAHPRKPDPELANAFHRQLKLLTQVPAALYDAASVPLRWSELLSPRRRRDA
jgi:capsular polysaccharide export protein